MAGVVLKLPSEVVIRLQRLIRLGCGLGTAAGPRRIRARRCPRQRRCCRRCARRIARPDPHQRSIQATPAHRRRPAPLPRAVPLLSCQEAAKLLIARQQGLQRITIWVQDGSAWRRARSAGVVDAAGGRIAATPWPVIGTTPSVLINPRAAHHGVGP